MGKNKFMSFMRQAVTQSVADSYEEETINVPISAADRLVCAIHEIEFYIQSSLATMASGDQLTIALLKNAATAIPNLDSTDVIAMQGIDINLVTSGAIWHPRVFQMRFNPPIMVIQDEIILAIDTSGQGVAKSVAIRIGYTLEKVSVEEFILNK